MGKVPGTTKFIVKRHCGRLGIGTSQYAERGIVKRCRGLYLIETSQSALVE